MIKYGQYGRKASWIVKKMENTEESRLNSEMIWKIWKKISWIVKWFGKYGRKVSWIVKRFGKCGGNVGWIVKWYEQYGRKVSSIMK